MFWHYWCKALGEKTHNIDIEADKVAVIRTAIVSVYLVTNIFIVAGIIHHW